MDKNAWLIQFQERGRFNSVEFDEMTSAEQVFDAIWSLEAEINNGGFNQYYFNSSGDTAFAVVAALRSVGAEKMARIVADANGVFPASTPPRDSDERQALMEALSPKKEERLEALSEKFLAYPDDLTGLLYAYVQQHLAEFRSTP